MILTEDAWRALNILLAVGGIVLLLGLFPKLWREWTPGERMTRMAMVALLIAVIERSAEYAVFNQPVGVHTALYTAALGWLVWGLILIWRDYRRGVELSHRRRS